MPPSRKFLATESIGTRRSGVFEQARSTGMTPRVLTLDEGVTMRLDAAALSLTEALNGTVRREDGAPRGRVRTGR